MKCIVCKQEIQEMHLAGHIFYAGIVEDVEPGYGSSHDLRRIRIGICDKCISDAEKNNIVEIIKDDL